MAEIRLYGKLRRLALSVPKNQDHILRVSPKPQETLEMLLTRVDIPIHEIYTIFFNAKLLATRSAMARWMGYPQVRRDPFDWKLNIPVNPNDRIGLFGSDMAALVI
jgi:hypothetical protein